MKGQDTSNRLYYQGRGGIHACVRLAFLCLSFLVLDPSISYPLNNVGNVLKVKKEAYVIRGGKKNDAKPRMPVMLKDDVETGVKSRAGLLFKDNSRLNLGESSRINVAEYLERPGKKRSKSIYKLVDGYLKVAVGKSALQIHSPTAVVAARGTEFILWVDGSGPSQSTGIIMIEGEAEVRNINELVSGILIIRTGQMSRVYRDKPPEKPMPANLKLIDDLNGRFGEIQTSGTRSSVDGQVINKSDINNTSNVSSGEGSESNVGSVVIK